MDLEVTSDKQDLLALKHVFLQKLVDLKMTTMAAGYVPLQICPHPRNRPLKAFMLYTDFYFQHLGPLNEELLYIQKAYDQLHK